MPERGLCSYSARPHSAGPKVMAIDGVTVLRRAAIGQNTAITAKLLFYKATTEARSKDHPTPLLLAVSENKQQMVEFLVNRCKYACS